MRAPFLISVNSEKVDIDPKEHTEYKWIIPEDIEKFDLAAGVEQDLEAVGLS